MSILFYASFPLSCLQLTFYDDQNNLATVYSEEAKACLLSAELYNIQQLNLIFNRFSKLKL